MKENFACSVRFFAVASFCATLLLGVSPAGAEQCARGQFWWKSKNKCIDKAEAAKLGFYHGPVPHTEKAAPEQAAEPEAAPAISPESAPAIDAPSVGAAQAMAQPPAPASPYGELVLEEFTKGR